VNRRETIKKLMTASGVIVSLPVWARSWSISSLGSYPPLLQDQRSTLAGVVETIIPTGNGIGALSVGVDKFVAKVIDKCYEPAVASNVSKQLESLNASSLSAHSKPFADCDQSQRETILLKYANSVNKDEKDFFNLVKAETIRGFNTSKEVMTKYLGYKIAPGHYYGCVDVKAS
jgi:hypothetical protein